VADFWSKCGPNLHLGRESSRSVGRGLPAAVLPRRTIKGAFEKSRVVGRSGLGRRASADFNSNQLIFFSPSPASIPALCLARTLRGSSRLLDRSGTLQAELFFHLVTASPAIIVALPPRGRPETQFGILIGRDFFFLALTFIWRRNRPQIAMKIPLDVTKVFQGEFLLFYVLACDFPPFSKPVQADFFFLRGRCTVEIFEAIILSVLAGIDAAV